MAVKKAPTAGGLRFPESLSLSDLISIISVAVSIALAWGYFGARITALEKEVIALHETADKLSSTSERLQERLHIVESQVHDTDVYVDQLYKMLKQSEPRRRQYILQSPSAPRASSTVPDAQDYLSRP